MEAATASGNPPLGRDGAIAATSPPSASRLDAESPPIDGVARCECCARFPLVGERVNRHAGAKGAGWVCSSCESAGRGERLGAITSSARIHSLGGATNVRRAV